MLLRNNQSGQALMIVLLALAAVASVALTISTRSTTDISVTTNVEDSQRAFTAAEAGIEKVLLDETAAIGGSLEENVGDAGASFTANADTIPEDPQAYAYPFKVAAGDVATLWFMSHDENGQLSCAGLPCYTATNIRVCWGEDGALPVDAGAVEITVYSQNSAGQIIASRTTLDEDLPRLNESGFEAGNEGDCGTIDGQQYAISRSLNFSVEPPLTGSIECERRCSILFGFTVTANNSCSSSARGLSESP